MHAFSSLYKALDEAKSPDDKVAAMALYFANAPPDDGAWAIYFLTGRRIKRHVKNEALQALVIEVSGLPPWLYDESIDAVGDLAETVALILPEPLAEDADKHSLTWWMERQILQFANQPEEVKLDSIRQAWMVLCLNCRLVFNKLVLGSFRISVSQDLLVQALHQTKGISTFALRKRLAETWVPAKTSYEQLIAPESSETDVSKPYSFHFPKALEVGPLTLGDANEWQAEWKWHGLRAQIIRRGGHSFIWTSTEKLISSQAFESEFGAICSYLSDGCVIDGQILTWENGRPVSIAAMLQSFEKRASGSKKQTKSWSVLVAFDILEYEGIDLRLKPLWERRLILERVIAEMPQRTLMETQIAPTHPGLRLTASGLILSAPLDFATWEELDALHATARETQAEGLTLKHRSSQYDSGEKSWLEWNAEPHFIDTILIYAEQGTGRDPSIFAEYTVGAWKDSELVPVAKVKTGLTTEEILEIDAFIKQNTLEKFGPVRTVKPELVMQLAFDIIHISTRHKSGLMLQNPRILKWQRDKNPEEAATLEFLKQLVI